MKKVKYLLILLITAIAITGCSSDDGKEILDEALANMANVKSASIVREMKMGTSDYSVTMTVTGDFDSNNGYSHYDTKISISGYAMNSESYSVERDGKLYTYTTSDNKTWYYTVADMDSAITDTSNLDIVSQYASKYKSVKKVKSDIDGMTKLELVIDKETMNELMSSSEDTTGMEILEDLTMFVYVKDGYIALIYLNLSDVMSMDATAGFTNVSMTISMSNYNSIDEITIPNDILENAILEDNNE